MDEWEAATGVQAMVKAEGCDQMVCGHKLKTQQGHTENDKCRVAAHPTPASPNSCSSTRHRQQTHP